MPLLFYSKKTIPLAEKVQNFMISWYNLAGRRFWIIEVVASHCKREDEDNKYIYVAICLGFEQKEDLSF